MRNLPTFLLKLKKELFLKFYHKIFSKNFTINKNKYYSWLQKESSDLEILCKKINSELWIEAKNFQEKIILKKKEKCKKELDKNLFVGQVLNFYILLLVLKNLR